MKLVTFFSFFLCAAAQTFYDTSTLVYTHVLFRHGDRTPDTTCKQLFENPNITYFPVGYGGLTAMGKNRQYAIGQTLRQRYNKFLGDIYFNELIEAISTDVPRTKMSLQLVLSSLFPPSNEDRWNWNLNWQPIPYNYVSVTTNLIFGYNQFFCKKYSQMYAENLKSRDVQKFLNNPAIREVLDIISNSTSISMIPGSGVEDAYMFYACFYAMEQTYQPIPQWTSTIFPDKLKRVASLVYTLQTWNNELTKYAGGPLVKKILDDADTKIAGNLPLRKISMYSAHEFNVAQLLKALNVQLPPFFPNYGSYVLVELHNVLGEYGFKVFLQNYDTASPRQLTISGCSAFCPLIKLKSLMANRLPTANTTC